MKLSNLWVANLSALIFGASTTLAFAPYNFWPLAFISVFGLLFCLHNKTPKQSGLVGFSYGFGLFATGISWVHVSMDLFGGMPFSVTLGLMGLLSAYLALFVALTGYFTNFCFNKRASPLSSQIRYLILFPALWLVFDWARGHFLTGFPWLWFGYSQIDTPLVGLATITGVQGVTLAVVLISAALFIAVKEQKWRPLVVITPVLFAAGYFLQQQQWTQPQPLVKVALVQGNIDQNLKWEPDQLWPSLFKYVDLTEANKDADIVIWPESAIAALEYRVEAFLKQFEQSLRDDGISLVTGIIDFNPESDDYYNAIISLGNTGKQTYDKDGSNRYYKHHLLPIGEFVPFEDLLRPLAPYFNLPMSSFSRGDLVQNNLNASGVELAAALCYEVAFSEQLRKNINSDTGMIVTVSNDAWFGDSIGPDQHLEIARMRAIEFGRPVVRGTNTGITAAFDAKGRELGRLPQFEEGVLKVEVTPTQGLTPYSQLGSWPLIAVVTLALAFVLAASRFKLHIPVNKLKTDN